VFGVPHRIDEVEIGIDVGVLLYFELKNAWIDESVSVDLFCPVLHAEAVGVPFLLTSVASVIIQVLADAVVVTVASGVGGVVGVAVAEFDQLATMKPSPVHITLFPVVGFALKSAGAFGGISPVPGLGVVLPVVGA